MLDRLQWFRREWAAANIRWTPCDMLTGLLAACTHIVLSCCVYDHERLHTYIVDQYRRKMASPWRAILAETCKKVRYVGDFRKTEILFEFWKRKMVVVDIPERNYFKHIMNEKVKPLIGSIDIEWHNVLPWKWWPSQRIVKLLQL